MDLQAIQNLSPAPSKPRVSETTGVPAFNTWLASSLAQSRPAPSKATDTVTGIKTAAPKPPSYNQSPPGDQARALAAYGRMSTPASSAQDGDWAKYRDDQLLSNPGGDAYHLAGETTSEPADEGSFVGRIGKDLVDAAANAKNFFKNLLFGAETHYRDPQGKVQTAERRGVVGSLVDFAKDMGGALSLGYWRPDGEAAPDGVEERASFVFDKLKEAVVGDLVSGVGGSVNQMGEDLLLAGWNLMEVAPDATLGNFAAGEKLVSGIFDNGQVAVDYITDVFPAGEAWLRVHSTDFPDNQAPVFYNLQLPEHFADDSRWRYVRNTPLRKTIETLGAVLADVVTLKFTGQLGSGSEKRR